MDDRHPYFTVLSYGADHPRKTVLVSPISVCCLVKGSPAKDPSSVIPLSRWNPYAVEYLMLTSQNVIEYGMIFRKFIKK